MPNMLTDRLHKLTIFSRWPRTEVETRWINNLFKNLTEQVCIIYIYIYIYIWVCVCFS